MGRDRSGFELWAFPERYWFVKNAVPKRSVLLIKSASNKYILGAALKYKICIDLKYNSALDKVTRFFPIHVTLLKRHEWFIPVVT